MMHVTQRFAKNELYIQFQNINVGLFGDYSKSIYQCQAFISMASVFCKINCYCRIVADPYPQLCRL